MSGKVQGLNREFEKKDVERMRNLMAVLGLLKMELNKILQN
jgi:hypothetical protein